MKKTKAKTGAHKSKSKPAPKSKALSPSSHDAETSYPVSEWMVPATDTHGHSAKVFTRVPPSYVHQMSAIIQKRKFPWDTPSDIVRIALHRFLSDVSKVIDDPEITSQQAILNSLVELSSREMEFAHFSDTLEKLGNTIAELLARDAEPMARKMVMEVAAQVSKFETGDWKTRYEKLLDKHKGLLK